MDYKNVCGANKMTIATNSTLTFIVTGDTDCYPRVTVTSSVSVVFRVSVNIDEFWNKYLTWQNLV